jgi:hypothetical protein
MPNYFLTVFGKVQGNGFSEVYPLVAANPTAADTFLSSLMAARIAVACTDVTFTGYRISDSDIKGDSWPVSAISPIVGTYVGAGSLVTYNPQISLRFLAVAGGLKRGSRWFRAIPEDQIDASGQLSPSGSWVTSIGNWEVLVGGNCSIATRNKLAIAPPFYTFTAITALTRKQAEARRIGRPFGLRPGRALIG